jgi:hypothetical protein
MKSSTTRISLTLKPHLPVRPLCYGLSQLINESDERCVHILEPISSKQPSINYNQIQFHIKITMNNPKIKKHNVIHLKLKNKLLMTHTEHKIQGHIT